MYGEIISPVTIFYIFSLLFINIGSYFYMHDSVITKDLNLSLLCFAVSALMVKLIFKNVSNKRYLTYKTTKIYSDKNLNKAYLSVVITTSILLFYIFGVPLFADIPDLAYVSFARNIGPLIMIFSLIIPMIVIFQMVNDYLAFNKIKPYFIVVSMIAIIMLSLTSRRYFQLDMMIWLIFAYKLCGGRIKLFTTIKLFCLAIALFVLIYIPREGIMDVYRIIDMLERRVLLIELRGITTIYEYFLPNNLLGADYFLKQLTALIPFISKDFNLGHELYWLTTHNSTGGYLPPTLYGEMLVCFGKMGAFIGMAAWGGILQAFYSLTKIALNKKKNVFTITFLSISYGYLGRSAILGFYNSIYQILLVFMLIVIFYYVQIIIKRNYMVKTAIGRYI